MVPSPVAWTWRDTVTVLGAFTVPFLCGVGALLIVDGEGFGTWSTIEIDWTAWAIIGMVLTLVKIYLLYGDLRSVDELGRGWRYQIGAWWTLANALGFFFTFLSWAIVGVVAGQIPGASPTTTVALISGGLFMMAEAVLIGVVTFGLICRVRLAQ